MAGVDFDFSDVDGFFEQGKSEVKEVLSIMPYSMAAIRTEQERYESQTNTLSRTKVWN